MVSGQLGFRGRVGHPSKVGGLSLDPQLQRILGQEQDVGYQIAPSGCSAINVCPDLKSTM